MSRRRATYLVIAATSIAISVLLGLTLACRAMPTREVTLVPQEPTSRAGATITKTPAAASLSDATAEMPSSSGPAAVPAETSAAASPPGRPSSFYGRITLNGRDVPEGTLITVGSGGTVYARTTSFIHEGEPVYRIDVPADDPNTPEREGGTDGEVLEFTVGGLVADQTAIWRSGSNEERSLMAWKS